MATVGSKSRGRALAKAFYNEIDKFAAAWLRNLIAAGHIAPGDVDERDIRDIRPTDLDGYTQCHFFAGIGVWSRSLRNAGWPDDRPVWTASCPCQPLSTAGSRLGFADERHLWPHFFHLVEYHRPPEVLGEQVASKDGLAWVDLVSADMEGADYTFGVKDICAAGFGAPHIRQRLVFVGARGLAHSDDARLEGRRQSGRERTVERSLGSGGLVVRLADHHIEGRRQLETVGVLRPEVHDVDGRGRHEPLDDGGRPGPINSFWRDADWLFCRDGKWRAVRPGTFPLAHGAASRVGRLRAYGNAIVEPQIRTFIESYLESEAVGHVPDRGLSGLTLDVEDLIG